jgi:hypothetical protein
MKKLIIIMFAIVLLSACASNTATQTQSGASGPTPTPPPFAEILMNNGFHATRNYCTGTCTSYEIYAPQTIAKVYDNGTFSIQAVASTGGVLDLQVFNLVLTQAYGQSVTDWAAEHLNASYRKEQSGSLGNYDLTMTGKENERLTITIVPR